MRPFLLHCFEAAFYPLHPPLGFSTGTRPPLRYGGPPPRTRHLRRYRGAGQHLPARAEALPGSAPVRRRGHRRVVGGGGVPRAPDAEGERDGQGGAHGDQLRHDRPLRVAGMCVCGGAGDVFLLRCLSNKKKRD